MIKKTKKLPKISTVRNKCDGLLTPIVKILSPHCVLCKKSTEVAHHHVHKSKSNRLRYDFINLISLCNHCHQALHHNESYWASKIVETKGIEWFKKVDKAKNEYVKTDVHFYIRNLQRLQEMLQSMYEKGYVEKIEGIS